LEVVPAALRQLRIEIPPEEVRRAVEASSFARMREHEDRVAGSSSDGAGRPRMIRAGRTAGWKDWMTPELAEFFSGDELRTVARGYGYDLSELS
jgi:hypothetical protein